MRLITLQREALRQVGVQSEKTSDLYLNLPQNRQGNVEWYILILILVEIVLMVYDLFVVR
jgi:uncharacterized Rmd1/YagE family protein